jgi:site-specific DNA-methyltransferase (adenine-specific)
MNADDYRIHPTQKPVALYKWLLNNYAKQGDKILDTHVGSASSLIACHQLGFDYIGFELDTDYYNEATKRLELVKAQLSFNDFMED